MRTRAVTLRFVCPLLLAAMCSCTGCSPQNAPTPTGSKQGSDDATRLYNLGNDHHRKKEYDQAVYRYTQALEANQNLKEAHLNRGIVRTLLVPPQMFQAVADLSRAIQLDPTFPNPYFYCNRFFLGAPAAFTGIDRRGGNSLVVWCQA